MGKSLNDSLPADFSKAVAAYVHQDFETARKALSPTVPQSIYGALQIDLEQGNPAAAPRWIRYLKTNFPNSIETEVVLNVLPPLSE
jgi:hypothetical protein